MSLQICWKGRPIGEYGPSGKTLDKAVFCALRAVERLRAYLCMAWPGSRSPRVLSRVCGVRREDVANYLATDLRDGVVVKRGTGRNRVQYQACPLLQRRDEGKDTA